MFGLLIGWRKSVVKQDYTHKPAHDRQYPNMARRPYLHVSQWSIWHHPRPQDWPQRQTVLVSEYLRDRWIWVRIGTTLSDKFYPQEGVSTGGVLAVTCFGLKINELPSGIAKDIFKAFFVNDLAICFRGRSLDTIERHLQQAENAIQEWATRKGFRFAAHKCKVLHSLHHGIGLRDTPHPHPCCEDWKHTSASGGVHEVPWDLHLLFKKHISVLRTQCKEALNLIRVVAHLKWGGDRDTLLMLYRAIVRSKFDYGCILYDSIKHQPTTTGQHS